MFLGYPVQFVKTLLDAFSDIVKTTRDVPCKFGKLVIHSHLHCCLVIDHKDTRCYVNHLVDFAIAFRSEVLVIIQEHAHV
jgi:hypothetical protein